MMKSLYEDFAFTLTTDFKIIAHPSSNKQSMMFVGQIDIWTHRSLVINGVLIILVHIK